MKKSTRFHLNSLAFPPSWQSLCTITFCILSAEHALAQDTWDGGGTTNTWSDGANWLDDTAPIGSGLTFRGDIQPSTINDLSTAIVPTSISFTNNSTVGLTSAFTLAGNPIILGGTISTSDITTGPPIMDTISLGIGYNTTRTFFTGLNHHLTISGSLNRTAGIPNLTKVGNGTLFLTNPGNSFSGVVEVNVGVLSVTAIADSGINSPLGSGSIIRLGNNSSTGALTFASGATSTNRQIQIGSNNNSGIGTGTIRNDTPIGAGTLVFTNANFNLPNPNTTSNGRTLTLSGTNTDANEVQGIIANHGGGGVVGITKADVGTWVLSGGTTGNTYSGATQVNGGVLVFRKTVAKAGGTATAAPAGSIGLGVGGVGFYTSANVGDLFNTNTLSGFNLNSGSGVAIDTTAGNFDQDVALTQARPLTKLGANTLTLSQTNSHTGTTSVAAGTLKLGNATDTLFGPVNVNGGILDVDNADTVEAVTLTSGTISGDSALTGTSYTVQSGSISSELAGTDITLTKTTAGTVILSGANTYTGATQVDGGILVFGNTTARVNTLVNAAAVGSVGLGVGGAGFYTAADVGDLFNTNTLAGFTLDAASGVAIDTTAGDFDQNVALTEARALTKLGANTLTLSQTNTHSGLTNVTNGTLRLGNATDTLTGDVNVNGGILNVDNPDTVGNVTLTSGTISGDSALTGTSYTVQAGTVSSVLAGSGVVLTKTTVGTVTLAGSNTYTGGTNVNAGTLRLGNATDTLTGDVNVNGGTLDVDHVDTVGVVTLTSGTISGDSALTGTSYALQSGTVSSELAGTGVVVTKSSSGIVTLSGVNTYTGATNVNAGTLRLGNATNTLSGDITVNGGKLDVDNPDTVGAVTLTTGAILGDSALTGTSFAVQSGTVSTGLAGIDVTLDKTTASTVILSGVNTYTGATTITDGTLLINSNSPLAVGTITVSGGILGGIGTLGGQVNVEAAGSLTPGNAAVGTLTLTSGLDISAQASGTGKLNFELNTISDRITVTGGLVIGTDALGFSDFNFSALAGLVDGTYTLISSGGITGSLDPDSADLTGPVGARTGTLQLNGNNIELVVSSDPFATWAGSGVNFDDDANNDGVENGLAWLLGAANPAVNATGLLPTITQTGGNITLNFDMLPPGSRGIAQLFLEHSSDLGISDPWTSVLVPDATGGAAPVTFTISGTSPLDVTATVASSQATAGKLFTRLRAER